MAILGAALAAAAPAHAAFGPPALRVMPDRAIATCLRPAGDGAHVALVGPQRGGDFPVDLVDAADPALPVVAQARLGRLIGCPAVAGSPAGGTVVAGPAPFGRRGAVRVATRAPGGPFTPATSLGPLRRALPPVAAAVSPRGDVLVAWVEERGRARGGREVRLMAARKAPGASFGRGRALTRWHRTAAYLDPVVAAALDAAGGAVVGWSKPVPGARRRFDAQVVEVLAAPPDGRFRADTLTRSAEEAVDLVATAGPDGGVLLAHTANEALHVFERAPGATSFARVPIAGAPPGGGQPAVAAGPDGTAVLAWRTGAGHHTGGVAVAVRARRGPFGPPREVSRGGDDRGSVSVALVESDGAPIDFATAAPRIAVGPGGNALVSWLARRPGANGDAHVAVRGTFAQGFARPTAVGSPIRSAAGTAPAFGQEGEAVATWVDNATSLLGDGEEIAEGDGRLMRSADPPPAGAAAFPAPPALAVDARPQTLRPGRPVRVAVRCDRPCDVRANVRERGGGTRTLPRGGRGTVLVAPFLRHGRLAPVRGGSVELVVRAAAPGGRTTVTRRLRVRLRYRRPVPLMRPVAVRARRDGRAVVVTWRTRRPAWGVTFYAEPLPRATSDGAYVQEIVPVTGGGRRRFTARVRARDGRRIRRVRITVLRTDPPYGSRSVVVPVR